MEQRANINLYQGDCMEAMSKMNDNQYDLAIVDIPYGIGDINHTDSRHFHKKIEWNNEVPPEEYFNGLFRVSKNQIIWGVNYLKDMVPHTGRIVHDKSPSDQQYPNLSDGDIASHSFGVNIKVFRYEWRGNVQGSSINWKNTGADRRIHPTQKPIALYKWLLEKYAVPGNKILDTHGGSMSIALACWDLKFDLDLWELDKDHYEAGKKRFDDYTMQGQFNF